MCLEIKGLWNAHLCCMTRSMLDIHLIRHLFPTRWLKIICSPTICFDPHIDQIGETPTLTQMIHGASFGNGAITPLTMATALVDRLKAEQDYPTLRWLNQALGVLSAKLEPKDVTLLTAV